MYIANNVAISDPVDKLKEAITEFMDQVQDAGLFTNRPRTPDIDLRDAEEFPKHNLAAKSLPPGKILQVAVARLQIQKAREKFLPGSVLRDYGWNILLDLFVHDLLGKPVSVSSACHASGGPATTALRWLRQLESGGLIVRSQDDQDRRKIYVTVTDRARDCVTNWLCHTA